jgi:hypothetical protein
MALDQAVVDLIRDEIGNETDFADNESELTGEPGELGSLESIYEDASRGDSNPLRTALIVWRRRLWSLQNRSFDLTTEGTLLNRRQRVAYVERRIKELELLVDRTNKGENWTVTQGLTSGSDSDGTSLYPEFS